MSDTQTFDTRTGLRLCDEPGCTNAATHRLTVWEQSRVYCARHIHQATISYIGNTPLPHPTATKARE